MTEAYKTVRGFGRAEMVEKKSRFIGFCKNVKTEDEAIAFINAVRAEHREATHNVYAYILRENNAMRYSDDGEPAGTAGVPVLEVLRKEGLVDAVVVVTRYFGGVLLGAGGLVRAYGKGAKIGVDAAGRVEMRLCNVYSVKTDYSSYGKLQYAIAEGGYQLRDVRFTEAVELIVCAETSRAAEFEAMVTELSLGRSSAELVSTEFVERNIKNAPE